MEMLLTLVQICFLILSTLNEAQPARRVDVGERVREMRKILTKRCGAEPIEQLLNLTKGESLETGASIKLKDGVVKKRLIETYNGIPVFDTLVTVDEAQQDITGSIIQDIDEDLYSIKPKYSEDWMIKKVMHLEEDDQRQLDFTHKKAKLWIYMDKKQIARLTYIVDYFAESSEKLSRPMYVMDAMTGEVLLKWKNLDTHAYKITGQGGNRKTGMYKFGSREYKKLQISRKNRHCIMENEHVRVVNLEHQTFEHTNPLVLPSCLNGVNDSINGAFSPANDALYFGTEVWNMFKNWFGVNVLKSKIILRVHFGKNYANAFWNGDEVTFGDGSKDYYPLVSLDVTAHEISHGFTEQNSGLLYFGESGAINEAFSDMAGIALKYFLKGKKLQTDWMFGYDVTRSKRPLRFMANPALDGKSIEHALQFHNGLDVHRSSGVFNRAFSLLSELHGWNIRRAFRVFVTANVLYWTPRSGFSNAACGLRKAAEDLGYHVEDVENVLSTVGVFCKPSKSYGIIAMTESVPILGIGGFKDSLLFFVINKQTEKGNIRITTRGGYGDCDLYVKHLKPPTTTQYDSASKKTGNDETILVRDAPKGPYFIVIRGKTSYGKVKLVAIIETISSSRKCTGPVLCNGVPVTALSAKKGQNLRYLLKVPPKCSVSVETNGGKGDADLYVRYRSIPTVHLWDYRPFIWGNKEKVLDPGSDEGGVYYIMLSVIFSQ